METVFAERVQKANVIAALAQMKLFNERRKSPSAIPNSEVGEGEGDDEGEREEGGERDARMEPFSEGGEEDSSSASISASGKKPVPRGFYHLFACDSVVSRKG